MTNDSKDSAPKPCPFCGFRPELEDPDFLYPITRERDLWGAHCPEPAGGCSASILGASKEDALNNWNRSASALARDEASVESHVVFITDRSKSIDEVLPQDRRWVISHAIGLAAAYRNCDAGKTKEVMQEFVDYLRAAIDDAAASSAATVSDAASVLTDEQIEAVWDAVDATDIDVNDRKLAVKLRLRFARAIVATSQAATTAEAQEIADAVKLACESRRVEFDIDAPGATVGRLLLWERDAATASVAPDEPVAFVRDNPDDIGTIIEATRPLDVGTPLYTRAASSATAPLSSDSQAARDVLAERQRQMSVEGWTPEHDDEHTESEMALAAACYAMAAGGYAKGQTPPIWPWSLSWWKAAYGRRDLVKAGALILAEIERLDRAQSTNGEQS